MCLSIFITVAVKMKEQHTIDTPSKTRNKQHEKELKRMAGLEKRFTGCQVCKQVVAVLLTLEGCREDKRITRAGCLQG